MTEGCFSDWPARSAFDTGRAVPDGHERILSGGRVSTRLQPIGPITQPFRDVLIAPLSVPGGGLERPAGRVVEDRLTGADEGVLHVKFEGPRPGRFEFGPPWPLWSPAWHYIEGGLLKSQVLQGVGINERASQSILQPRLSADRGENPGWPTDGEGRRPLREPESPRKAGACQGSRKRVLPRKPHGFAGHLVSGRSSKTAPGTPHDG